MRLVQFNAILCAIGIMPGHGLKEIFTSYLRRICKGTTAFKGLLKIVGLSKPAKQVWY